MKLAFDSQFQKNTGYFEYPKLKLEQSEKARICIIDSSPEAKYVHTLRKIVLRNGRPVMETQKYGKNNDKEREVPSTDFVGKFICLGDDTPDGPLDKNEIDPNNCPACKAAAENGAAVDKPQRRIVFHVLKYKTAKGSFNVQAQPFQAELVAWDITDNRFKTLIEIQQEHGNLAEIDLNLGPCENAGYQKFDIMPGRNAEWAKTDERKNYTKQVWAQTRSEELTKLLGREVSATELRSLVSDVVNYYNLGFGQNDSNSIPNREEDFSASIDFSGTDNDFFSPGGGVDLDSTPAPSPSPVAEAEESEEKSPESSDSSKSGAVENLDDLLKGFE